MQSDFRSHLSAAEFNAIEGEDRDYLTSDYYTELLANNPKFKNLPSDYRGFTDPRLLPQLTKGQQLLALIGDFDGQVKNGGVTQFFWNCPHILFDVRDAVEYLGQGDLLRNYELALESLVGNKDRWYSLREECYREPKDPKWEPFQKTYDLLDLGWFDEAYFDKRGYDDQKQWVVQRRGLHYSLLNSLCAYITSHRNELIAE